MKNCDCIHRVEQSLSEFMRGTAGDDAKATIQNTVFYMSGHRKVGDVGGSLGCTLQIPFRVKGSRKGYTSERGKEIGCNVSFCPFCGKPANREVPIGEDEGIAAAFASTAALQSAA